MLNWVKSHPIITGIAVLIVAAIGWGVLSPEGRDYEYVVEEVSKGDVLRVVSASGTLRALNETNVGAEVSGQITEVYVDFNTPVSKGQLLAQIDPTRPLARVTQARAQVDLAKASLAQAKASIDRSRADVEVQKSAFDRQKELAEKGFVSAAGLERAENTLIAARAALNTAEAQAQSARAQIAQSTAELESAQLDLSRTRIVAPTSGVVINKLVEPGTTVAASFQTPNLFTIAADTSRMQVEASVDEADIGQVKEGQDVRFSVDPYPEEEFVAKVQQIRQSATRSGTAVSYLVILDVDNKDGRLLTGMTANVDIITGRKRGAVRVPVAATRFLPREEDREEDGDGQGEGQGDGPGDGGDKPGDARRSKKANVWVPGEDPYKPNRNAITTGLEGEDYVEIRSGLKPGQSVIIRSRNLTDEAQSSGRAAPR
ncbi:MAG: efflux RND transporter periplasmic adaptor subunit [Pseudomonadota bacterium]